MRYALVPHPDMPPNSISAVDVDLLIDPGDDILLRYLVTGPDLLLPEWKSPARADGLWQTTCFELFLGFPDSDGYFEFNFSPSTEWAAYEFEAYRTGGRPMTLSLEPHVERNPEPEEGEGDTYPIEVQFDLSDLPNVSLLMGLTAVIEEKDGTKSYWALAHPPGAPDFHHKDCFALELPAAKRA